MSVKISVMSVFSISRKLDLYHWYITSFCWTSFTGYLSLSSQSKNYGELSYPFSLVWHAHARYTHADLELGEIQEKGVRVIERDKIKSQSR